MSRNPKPIFTPGPWSVGELVTVPGFPYTPVLATTLIAAVYSTAFGDYEQSAANGALIAATPEMFAILDRMTELYAESDANIKRLKKAQADLDIDAIATCMTQAATTAKEEHELMDAARALLKKVSGEK